MCVLVVVPASRASRAKRLRLRMKLFLGCKDRWLNAGWRGELYTDLQHSHATPRAREESYRRALHSMLLAGGAIDRRRQCAQGRCVHEYSGSLLTFAGVTFNRDALSGYLVQELF